ncbi:MAG: large subunit ribosomal protein L17 [Marinoscillum sp.]|jgi:large subunit ribosomal protein L17
MRHGKKFNHLGRTAPHRKAMLSNMASSLILHKRINTTLAKAKALTKYVEPLITKSKTDTTHSRRVAFSYLQDKFSVQELFGPIAEKVSDRPGGYTRIIKTGTRLGDNAEMCMMELVDFNELLLQESDAKSKTRRSRRGTSKKSTDAVTETKPSAIEDATIVEEVAAATEVVEEEESTPEANSSDEASESTEEGTEEPKKVE